ncbi:glycoside hydrolase family 18 protein [Luteimonas sp. SDU82]|uniref:glycoside hydrolase family 18 protein n=1 Tax=Luteimonas sp. SDU82 TaxID=3422592 RepID=UPI003EB6A4FE
MRQSRWMILCGMVLALSLSMASAAVASPSQDPRLIGYLLDRDAPLPTVDDDRLDTVIYSFAVVDAQHRVHLPRAGMAERLSQLAGASRADVLLAIGGWGADHFSEAAATARARRIFADTAVALVERHDLDGLDIDWEYPALPGPGISHSPADRAHFPLLLQALRDALDALTARTGRHYRLTIAAADGEAARGLDLPRIVPLVDAIHLMTYDFYGAGSPRSGHHAGLYRSAGARGVDDRDTTRAIDEFLAAGVPPHKLVPGAAFYGKAFTATTADNAGLHQPFAGEVAFVTWRELRQHQLSDPAFERHYDPQAQAAWLWNPATRVFISHEDVDTVRAKATYARLRGLGGLMFWELGGDDADGSLLDAADQGLRGTAR